MFSVLLNGLFFGIGAILYGEVGVMFPIALGAAIGGIILSSPLLFFILPLAKVSCRVPYNTNGKIAWLTTMFMATGLVFLILLEAIITGDFFQIEERVVYEMMLSPMLSIIVAVYFERNTLKRRYEVQSTNL